MDVETYFSMLSGEDKEDASRAMLEMKKYELFSICKKIGISFGHKDLSASDAFVFYEIHEELASLKEREENVGRKNQTDLRNNPRRQGKRRP